MNIEPIIATGNAVLETLAGSYQKPIEDAGNFIANHARDMVTVGDIIDLGYLAQLATDPTIVGLTAAAALVGSTLAGSASFVERHMHAVVTLQGTGVILAGTALLDIRYVFLDNVLRYL